MTVRLWLRADGSAAMGLGHVMRLLALAERARDQDINPCFVVGGSQVARDIVVGRGFAAVAAVDGSRSWLDEIGRDDLVIFDGYQFELDLLRAAGRRASRVAAVDDFEDGDFPVDVLLNQNPVPAPKYTVNPDGVVLIGPRYALVRQEFLEYRRDRSSDPAGTLLITMGGSDVAGLARVALQHPTWPAYFERMLVVVGPAADLPAEDLPSKAEVVRSPADVAGTFAAGDAAISAAGSTTWELLAMGLPTALVQVVDNQRHIGPGVAREEAALFLGDHESFASAFGGAVRRLAEPTERKRLSTNALALVDGHGADRLLQALLERTLIRRRWP